MASRGVVGTAGEIMVHIVTATDEHIPQVSELFADAFMDDPVWKAIAPSPRIRRHVIKAECEWGVGLRGSGSVDVALDGSADGRVLGALTFETPDMLDIDDEYGWKETLRGLVRGRLPAELRGAKHQKAVDLYQPDGPHWYLHDIATSPDVRGQGIGSALLRHRLALIDVQPAPVFLEATTDASRRLYERYGFSVVAEVSTLPETLSYAMIREAM